MNSDVLEEFRRWLMEADDIEGALRVLRDGGYSKIQCMKALTDTGKSRLPEAKVVVHESVAWEGARQRDSEFHEVLENEVKRSKAPRRD